MARTGRKPWPKDLADAPGGPLSDALRQAIAESGMNNYALAKKAGLADLAVRKVVGGGGDIAFSSAEKLFKALGLALVDEAGRWIADPATPLSDALREAIAASELTPKALGVRSGVGPMHITRFIRARGGITLATADRLARALGLGVARRAEIRSAEPKPVDRPLSDSLRAEIVERGLDILELSKASRTDRDRLDRFVEGKGDLRLITVDKLFDALSLAVVRDLGDHDSRPMCPSEAVRSAIVESGLSYFELARRSGAHSVGMAIFARGEGDMMMETADAMSRALGLKVVRAVRDADARRPAPKPLRDDPLGPLSDALRAAVAARGLGCNAVARLAGLSHATISRFLNRKRNLDYACSIKLANGLGLNPDPERILSPDEASSVQAQSSPVSGRICPVELRGESVPPTIYGVEVPILTRDEFAIMSLYVKAFAAGSEGYTRRELSDMTGSSTPWRTVAIMRNKPGYEAWREVLPDRNGAKKGERFGLVDPRKGRW